jgi:hypothetical protein
MTSWRPCILTIPSWRQAPRVRATIWREKGDDAGHLLLVWGGEQLAAVGRRPSVDHGREVSAEPGAHWLDPLRRPEFVLHEVRMILCGQRGWLRANVLPT